MYGVNWSLSPYLSFGNICILLQFWNIDVGENKSEYVPVNTQRIFVGSIHPRAGAMRQGPDSFQLLSKLQNISTKPTQLNTKSKQQN